MTGRHVESVDTDPKPVDEAFCIANKVPLEWRDGCAHLLVPLNRCRREHFYLPWHCTELRHAYEVCQQKDYIRRKREAQQMSERLEGSSAH
ncbi:NADH dehydrogenase I beta subcomplex 7 [Cyanidioschyzon merolae strain 10D]|jgi:NADH dehydrogenase (ubiquinone) 1 beta subcomplex subunit 7|uniref:NADH dehydrogenase [ubiquinone] 1 beta subcomplex subunit 7 n=1 Tax=Cyanidioschyzon merolae (strain NIES-3377 / 10D) TaxID=280699 RepID=M1UNP7_CYAM1|nr:NADH dehydrogenase I beta subcomplex 7 [Cyanidioschyzon merolae strain 10D]BAM79031.1 NADH dehydrogenase I beta subcomplex 7 [Cyanidioschyzon merolae strain 10D]|eukprot:XP_005535317.1 NADH dehydrogenase I beta subcomplex 7 [Cyanidioschyzon merolae strain 10D]